MQAKKKQQNEYDLKGIISTWIFPAIIAVVIAVLINNFLFFDVYVPTESMVPTINKNDKLIIQNVYNTNNIKRGDIVVFYSDELQDRLIKRLIGLPGDHIEIHDGVVNVNGEDIDEDYVKNNDSFVGIFDVPQNKFFFLGDNRAISNDSRKWINPYIDKKSIEGKAILRFYPISDFGSLNPK